MEKSFDLLARVGHKCPVVGESGSHLSTALESVSKFDKHPEFAYRLVTTEVRREVNSVKIIVMDVSSGGQFVLSRKLPSLARADDDAAKTWAAQLAAKVCIEHRADGSEGVAFRSYSALNIMHS